MPRPYALGAGDLLAWRLDRAVHGSTWNSGEGAYRTGGRWNSKGTRAVYCSRDPATAILEVAVHNTFRALDTVPHVMTAIKILDPAVVFVVDSADVPNANWLRPGIPSAGQQAFGDRLLTTQTFSAIPSSIYPHSWNLIFDDAKAAGHYIVLFQEPFALDTRLHPPP